MHKALLYHGNPGRTMMNQTDMYNEARRKGEVVHSGHFMISSVADDQEDIEDIDHNRDSPVHHEHSIMIKYCGYDFSNVPKETKDTYQFGPLPSNQITIDASLARLFRCMSLAYQGGKVVSPKWKNFKGMKLTVKDKIRLNNAIWRTWHIQYVMRKRKYDSVIQFATPLDLDANAHARPEAVVMEGKYWKRRIETVVAEYKKWRAFFMEKLKLSDYPGLMWVTQDNLSPLKETYDIESIRTHDDNPNDFTDTLFSSLSHQPFHFPNPREIAMHATNSDMMQPGLLQLQPSMDDMDFDPFQEFFSPPKKNVVSFTGAPSQPPNNDFFQISDFVQDESVAAAQQCMKIAPTMQAPPSTQAAMDFADNFTDVHRQDGVTLLHEPVATDDSIFSSVVPTSEFYAHNNDNRLHHVHQHQCRPQQQTNVPSNNVVSPLHFQQLEPKHYSGGPAIPKFSASSSTIDSTFIPIQNNLNVMHKNAALQQKPYHVQSKHVVNSPANKITYSHTQISQPLEVFPGNQARHLPHSQPHQLPPQAPVAVEPNNRGSIFHADQIHTSHVAPSAPVQVSRPSHQKVEYNNVQAAMPQQNQQQPSNNIIVTTADAMLLKKLLANKVQPAQLSPTQRQPEAHHRKRHSTSGCTVKRQSPQITQQYSPKSALEPVKRGRSRTNDTLPIMKQVAGPAVEKRKSVDDPVSFLDGKSSDIWPNKRKPSPVKAILQDVEMEFSQAFQPISPLAQDNELIQMDSRQSLSTEQKRRFNIKVAFARLQKLLPGCTAQANSKVSKATMLTKAAHFIKSMQAERAKAKEEIEILKKDLEKLQQAINTTQLELPATGALAPRPQVEEATKHFLAWTHHRTKQNWKFSLFTKVIEPWFQTYQKSVSVSGSQEFRNSIFLWLEDHCSLRVLRPSVVRSLQVISTTTTILTNPSQLRRQVEASVKEADEQAG